MENNKEPVVRQLPDTRAVITGGTSGIGLETALQLARAGTPEIVLNGRDAAKLSTFQSTQICSSFE